MQWSHFYRFAKTEVERLSALSGEDSWYCISDASETPVLWCHVVGSCLGGTSTFHATRDDPEVLFRLEPKRKVLNLTYFVHEGAHGPRLGKLRLFASRGMKVSDAADREVFRVIDPQSRLDKLMQDVLEGCCTEYAIVDDDRVIGRFERRERPRAQEEQEEAERPGLVRRLLRGVARALTMRDYCVELEDEGKGVADHRLLIAALILLKEQTIKNDQAH